SLTASDNEEGDGDSALRGADLTLRKSASTWLKLQGGQSEGLVASSLRSEDGGFGFVPEDGLSLVGADGGSYRGDLNIGFDDIYSRARGNLTLYTQSLEAGYSAPGFTTLTDRDNYGGTFRAPLGDPIDVGAKADKKVQDLGLETTTQEVDVAYQMTEKWSVS